MLRLFFGLILVATAPGGCAASSAPEVTHTLILDAADGGHARAQVTLGTARRLLGLGPITANDVGLVTLQLVRVEADVEIPRGSLELGPGQWGRALTILHLRANSTYRLRGVAYRGQSPQPAWRISALGGQDTVQWQVKETEETIVTSLTLQLNDTPRVVVSTVAGGGEPSVPTGLALQARFNAPRGLALTPDGTCFLADATRIWRISPRGFVTPWVGTDSPGDTDGPINAARFRALSDLILHPSGALIVLDQHRVRHISAAGEVTTLAGEIAAGFADGTGLAARFNRPHALVLAPNGHLFVADTDNHRIRRITPDGTVSTVAGQADAGLRDGTGSFSQFSRPEGLALTSNGLLVVADTGNWVLRVITPQNFVSTWVGRGEAGLADGPAQNAEFFAPRALAVTDTDAFYLLDGNRLRLIGPEGHVSTVAGSEAAGDTDAAGSGARLAEPRSLAITSSGSLVLADTGNQRLRAVTPAGQVTTWAGRRGGFPDGTGGSAHFSHPTGVAFGPDGTLYVADSTGCRIRAVSPDGRVTTLAGTGAAGHRDGEAARAQFEAPRALTVAPDGTLYVADGNRIRTITPAGMVNTWAGEAEAGLTDGLNRESRFNTPSGLALHASGLLYVADTGNHCIRSISADGEVSTLAGAGSPGFANGTGASAYFDHPEGIAIDPTGAHLYVCDRNNHRIRVVSTDGGVTNLAGSGDAATQDGLGSAASFAAPTGIAVDEAGTLYVTDQQTHRIRKLTPWGAVSTLTGTTAGYQDGSAEHSLFSAPSGLSLAADGSLVVADTGNRRIRRLR